MSSLRLFTAALAVALIPLSASADERARVAFVGTQDFATLPAGVRFPEGITANPRNGDVIVGTFDFGPNPNKLVRFTRNGKVAAMRDFGAAPLLGLGFARDRVYILNVGDLTGAGAAKLQRIASDFGESTPVEDVALFPSIGAPAPRSTGNPDGSSDTITFGSAGAPAPNAMVFDRTGNLYVSDSFQGAIFRIDNATTCAAPCPVTLVSHDPLLATAGFPPFGANGLALSADEKTLYIANTGDNHVLAMDVASAAITVFAESLHGADGLLFENGRLWVATNQADQLVALNADGRPVIKAGEFEGIRRDGTPEGLLFPASMVVNDGWMYIANLALPLTGKAGDEPEESVRTWTISRMRVPR